MAAFTTIAALGMSAAGSAFSFIQAGKQAQAERDANKAAAKALAEAKKKLEVNMLSGLSIAKEPYELARENLLQGSAAALQAGVEGETRGAAATAGQVLMAQQAQAGQQRASMSQEIKRLEELAAREESRLQSARVDLDLGEVKGAQQAAANFQAAADAAKAGAIKSAAGALTTGVQIFSENPFDVTKAAGGTSAPSLGTYSGTDYSNFGQDLISFDSTIPNLNNDPFYQFMQPGVSAPKLG